MATLTFDGSDLFNLAGGSVATVSAEADRIDEQRYGYPGVDGSFVKLLGTRIMPITVRGVLVSSSWSDWRTKWDAIKSVQRAGTVGDLVERPDAGEAAMTWSNCRLAIFRPLGRRYGRDPIDGKVRMGFEAVFEQLAFG